MNPKNTTFYDLEIFLAAAKEKNFSEVARRYDVASSVISRQIKQLETDFGQTLVYRNLIMNRQESYESTSRFFSGKNTSRRIYVLYRLAIRSWKFISLKPMILLILTAKRRI